MLKQTNRHASKQEAIDEACFFRDQFGDRPLELVKHTQYDEIEVFDFMLPPPQKQKGKHG